MTVIKPLERSNVVVAGIARNCADVIASQICVLSKAFGSAKSLKFLIVESDSIDNTAEIITSVKSHFDIELLSLGELRYDMPSRTERIAYCRNRYLQSLFTNKVYEDTDLVVIADLDGVNTELTHDAVTSCWAAHTDWDACFANQSAPYYDVWALRHKEWSPNDCWEVFEFLLSRGVSRRTALQNAVYSRMLRLPKNLEPIRVESAFGGLGIYKKNVLAGAAYSGKTEKDDDTCEHVPLHASLIDKGFKLYVMPSLINCGWNEHNYPLSFSGRIRSALRAVARSVLTVARGI